VVTEIDVSCEFFVGEYGEFRRGDRAIAERGEADEARR